MDRLFRRPVVFLLLACATLFYLPLGMRALWDASEGRYAEIAREMLELKDWLVPHLNYVVYFDKPPLMYWLTAVSLRLLGPNEFAARFWCAAFGVLTVGLTYRIGRDWKNERVGLLAGGFLATSALYFALTQFLVPDMALTFWTTLTLFAGSGLLTERNAQRSRRWAYLCAVGAAGGVLTKGPSAFIVPLASLLIVYLRHERRRSLPKIAWKGAMLLFIFLAAPWFIFMSLRFPLFAYHFFHENIVRYVSEIHRPAQPFYFYLPIVLIGFMPWSVFLPKVARTWWSHRHAALQRDPVGGVWMTWICLYFVLLSLAYDKPIGALLPIFPALALLVAGEFDEALEEPAAAGVEAAPEMLLTPLWASRGVAALTLIFMAALIGLKAPSLTLAVADSAWKALVLQSDFIALVLGLGVFVLVGVWGMRQTSAALAGIMLMQVLLLTTTASTLPELNRFKSTSWIAKRLRAHAGPEDPVAAYGVSYERRLQTLPFYLGRRVAILGPAGELSLGAQYDPQAASWFVGEDNASQAMLAMPPGTWSVTDSPHWQSLRQLAPPETFEMVEQAGDLVLFRKAR